MTQKKGPKARPERVRPDRTREPEVHAVPATMSRHMRDFLEECGDDTRLWTWQDIMREETPMDMKEAARELEAFDEAGIYASAPDAIESHLTLDELVNLARDMRHTEWFVHRKVYESDVMLDPDTAACVYAQMLDDEFEIPQRFVDDVIGTRRLLVAEAARRGGRGV